MKIAILGSGGREHALTFSISKSNKVKKIYCIPGNAGTSSLAENISIDAWTVRSYTNETHQYTNLAINHSEITMENTTIDMDGDHIVIVMSVPGPIKLEMASSIPVSDYLPEGGIEYDETIFSAVDTSTVVILIILLTILILPATFQLIRLIRTPQHELFPPEEE